ncbi:Lytic transglycosylase, catalytic [Nitratireductor basaltis]|uniref:Lytic transglycosylase, catalytic n=2 Tax=Nitratireductor basaltis TaxID=472175 RepID=A0A084U9B7_9HYPH|nr:Lytic transglycosylase, catalytic [Nitratireductor basaltis]
MQRLAIGLICGGGLFVLAGCTQGMDPSAAKSANEITQNSLVAEQDRDIADVDGDGRPDAYAAGTARPAALTALEAGQKPPVVGANSPELDALIARYAAHYEVPERLVRRVVKRESNFNPAARNRIYWGLMQIRHDTAQTMGYRGPASGLLDAETNLKYAVKYLRGAYLTADGNEDRAVRFYASGYYYDAKRKGLLKETGLRP